MTVKCLAHCGCQVGPLQLPQMCKQLSGEWLTAMQEAQSQGVLNQPERGVRFGKHDFAGIGRSGTQ